MRDLARVEALPTLPNLLKLLATRTSGLLNLADVGRDAALPHTTLTRYLSLLETVFLVRKQISWTSPQTALYHLRTAAGSEVDVVLEQPDGSVAGIEVKANASAVPSDFAALRTLRDELGKRFVARVVLYTGDQIIPSGDQLWLVPLRTLGAD